MNNPLIDIIIAVYNGERFIGEAIDSIQAQTLKNLNIIVIDDGSEDDTVKVVSDLIKTDSRILLEKRAHAGVSAALNAGIAKSTADYIAFLDADDLWHPQKLEKQIEYLTEKKADICFCLMQEFKTIDAGERMNSHNARPNPMKGYSKTAFLGHSYIFKKYGLFNETIAIGDFIDWIGRVIRAENLVATVDEVLAYRRIHSANTTLNVDKKDYLHILKMHLDESRRSNKE